MIPYLKTKLIKALISHFGDDDRRIEHALRVCSLAEQIQEAEGGDREVVLAVGLLHDVGIKEAEARHGTADGKLQERYGPALAERILRDIGLPSPKIAEACAIIGKHHTPDGVPGLDFQILWEADLLVNVEDDLLGAAGQEKLLSIIEKNMRTETGKRLAEQRWLGRQ